MLLYELYKVLDDKQVCDLYYYDNGQFSYTGMYKLFLKNVDAKIMYYLVDNIKVMPDGRLSITLIPN